ncbi:MAG TPA: endonuclease/exonuclease/phosphatase family protein [Nocardioides sp.]|nr:endonuclease/exonuclease/phosphatase family protein [Nocardioides sp.]
MRIGTWNLAGRWSDVHASFLLDLDCDVLLLTEVSDRVLLPGYSLHLGGPEMARRRRWAGIASRVPPTPLPDPHPASAMAVVDGWTYCSSILPWRSAGRREPWAGARHAEWTAACVAELLQNVPSDRLIWGGDWNHALCGREHAGSIAGRSAILAALEKLDLVVPTADLPHHIPGLLSIDHIAVPRGTRAQARAVGAMLDGRRLSDHEAYVLDALVG